jgi:hypothetical protein
LHTVLRVTIGHDVTNTEVSHQSLHVTGHEDQLEFTVLGASLMQLPETLYKGPMLCHGVEISLADDNKLIIVKPARVRLDTKRSPMSVFDRLTGYEAVTRRLSLAALACHDARRNPSEHTKARHWNTAPATVDRLCDMLRKIAVEEACGHCL